MSSSEAPITPASKKSSNTSSVPTDLTVSSNEKDGPTAKDTEKIAKLEHQVQLLQAELSNQVAVLEVQKRGCEEKIRQFEERAIAAEQAQKAAEETAKLRMELQSREMGRIQAAISEQLRDVASRQASLEALNDKLRQRPEMARQQLLGSQFQLSEDRLQQLKNIRHSDLSLSECAELLIYRHVWPERDRARRTEALNKELKARLEEVEREAAQLASTLQLRSADGQSLTSNLRQKEVEMHQIRASLKELDGLNAALQDQIRTVERQRAEAEAQAAIKEAELNSCRSQLQQLTRQLCSSGAENSLLSQNLMAMKRELEAIRFKCDAIEQKSDLGISGLATSAQAMQKKQLSLLEQLSADVFQHNLDKKYREEYLSTIQELITEQIRTQQLVARMGQEREDLLRSVQQLTERYKNAQMELLKANLQLKNEGEKVVILTQEVERLEHKLSNVQQLTTAAGGMQQQLVDVKQSKEYQTLLRDLQLLLSHRDEIADMKQLVIKLQQNV